MTNDGHCTSQLWQQASSTPRRLAALRLGNARIRASLSCSAWRFEMGTSSRIHRAGHRSSAICTRDSGSRSSCNPTTKISEGPPCALLCTFAELWWGRTPYIEDTHWEHARTRLPEVKAAATMRAHRFAFRMQSLHLAFLRPFLSAWS